MSGAHVPLTQKVVAELRSRGLEAKVLVGGVIPEGDVTKLEEAGAAGVFPTGADFDEIARRIEELAGG
jgi:methylmalonyl-CoA mutase C-terminal domain/subunit